MAFTSGWLCRHELRNPCATCPCPLEQNSSNAIGQCCLCVFFTECVWMLTRVELIATAAHRPL